MKSVYLLLLLLALFPLRAIAQNNLSPGDIAIVSYQSDTDLSNTFNPSVAEIEDRFSIAVLKPGGLTAGTVIYITDRGWDGVNATWLDATVQPARTPSLDSEAVIRWVIPAGGLAQGAEVFFIARYHDELPTGRYYEWKASSDEAGNTLVGTVTTETPAPVKGMHLSSDGDNLIVYQTGPVNGPAGGYNDAQIRFITGLLANVASGTTYAGWDAAPQTSAQSSLPPGLTNGATAFLMTPNVASEQDNGKYMCNGSTGACTQAAQLANIYNVSYWAYSNSPFPIGLTSTECPFSIASIVVTNPTTTTGTINLPFQETFSATGGTGTMQYTTGSTLPAGFQLAQNGTLSGTTTQTGTFPIVVTAIDANGCSGTGTTYNLVISNSCVPPSFTACPGNIVLSTTSNSCDRGVAYSTVVNGSPASNITYTFSGATTGTGTGNGSGSIFKKGVTNVVVTANNGCAPNATCSFTVTVRDSIPPSINCPANVTVTVAAGQCTANVITGPPTVSDNCQPAGNGLNFDGVDDRLAVPYFAPGLNRTIEFFIKTSSTAYGDVMSWGGSTNNSIEVLTDGGTIRYAEYNGSAFPSVISSRIDNGQWHHVAIVRTAAASNNVTIYIDGVVNATGTANFSLSTDAFAIGMEPWFGGFIRPMAPGSLDEIRVWNVARTQAQIQASMFTTIPAQAGLVLNYRFDQGIPNGTNTAVTQVLDQSASAFHGTMANFQKTGTTSNFVQGNPLLAAGIAISNSFNGTSNASGAYPIGLTTVTWTATDSNGNAATCTQNITVDAPEINVTGNSVTIPDGKATASLTDHTDFGNVQVGMNLTRTYTIQNTGTSSLVVSGITKTGTDAAMFSIGTLTPASPIAPSGSATFTVTFTPTSAGAKTATLNIANSDCSEALYDFSLGGTGVVCAKFTPGFVPVPPANLCSGNSITYTTQAGQSNYTWSVPGTANTDYTITAGSTGTSSNTVTLTWLTTGSKTVTVDYSDVNGCPSTGPASATTQVNAAPSVTPAGPLAICPPGSVLLTSSVSSGNQWYRNGNLIGGATGQTYSVTLAGSYTVTTGCSTSAPVVVAGDTQAPVAHCKSSYSLALASGTGSVLPAQIDSLSTDNCSIASYAVSTNTFTCANPGPQQVTLIITDAAGLVDSCHTMVTAQYPLTAAPINVTPSSTVNTGGIPTNLYLGYGPQSDTLKASATGGSGITYSWYPAADLSCTACQNPVITPMAAGTYVRNVIATNSNGCSDTSEVAICVRDLRVPGSGGKNFYLCHQQSATSTSQTLSVSLNLIAQHLSQHPYDRFGQCNIPSTTSVCSGAMLRSVGGTSGEAQDQVIVYPNPNNGTFTVELPYIAEDAEIRVSDLRGRMISRRSISEDDTQKVRFDLSAAPGMYFIQVVNGSMRQQFRILIQ